MESCDGPEYLEGNDTKYCKEILHRPQRIFLMAGL
jgi:hypothetical protein